MAEKSSAKSVSASVRAVSTPTDPTADIDDDWTLDEEPAVAAAAGTMQAQGSGTMPKVAPQSNAAADPPTSANPGAPASPSVSKSDIAETEEIDSEWPDDASAAESLTSPKIPSTAKLPSEAKPAESPAQWRDSSIAAFEAAASALSKKHDSFAFSTASAPEAPKGPTENEVGAASSRPGESSAPSHRESRRPEAGLKRPGKGLWLGLAAAAILIAGVGLSLRSLAPPQPGLERAQNALRPERDEAAPQSAPRAAARLGTPSAPAAAHDQPSDTEKGAASEAADASTAPALPESMTVKVNVFPADTQIYHKGKLLGTGGEEIELPAGERMLLVLMRDGYWPRKLILDGKETEYNVGLRRQPPPTFLPQKSSSETALEGTAPGATTPAATTPAATTPAATTPTAPTPASQKPVPAP